MAFQLALLGLGPAGWLACGVITIIMIAGAGIAIHDNPEINLDDDGIGIVYPPEVINNTDPGHGQGQGNNNSNSHSALWGFVHITETETIDLPPEWIPDDFVPPSSSFSLYAKAYSSGAHVILFIVMCLMLLAFAYGMTRRDPDEVRV